MSRRASARWKLRVLRGVALAGAAYGFVVSILWPAVGAVLFDAAVPACSVWQLWWLPFLAVALVTLRPRPVGYRVGAILAVAGFVYAAVGIGVLLSGRAVGQGATPMDLVHAGVLVLGFSGATLAVLGAPSVRAAFAARRRDRLLGPRFLLPLCLAAAVSGGLSELVHRSAMAPPGVDEPLEGGRR